MSNHENVKSDQIDDLLKSIYEMLANSKLPEMIKGKIKEGLEQLKEFTLDARPARIAIVGRRGAENQVLSTPF